MEQSYPASSIMYQSGPWRAVIDLIDTCSDSKDAHATPFHMFTFILEAKHMLAKISRNLGIEGNIMECPLIDYVSSNDCSILAGRSCLLSRDVFIVPH